MESNEVSTVLPQQPSFVQSALQILKELGESPIWTLSLDKFTTVNKYAIWCAQQETQPSEGEALHYYSQLETAAMLHCSVVTIIDYRKKGWLVGRRLGNRILFTKDDIDSAVKKIAVERYKRA
jgi:hypothetical protein